MKNIIITKTEFYEASSIPQAFSVLIKEKHIVLNISLSHPRCNLFTKQNIEKALSEQCSYLQPDLGTWLEVFDPLVQAITTRQYNNYKYVIRVRDDMLSMLYECLMRLHKKGYYLHRSLIEKCFLNDIRKFVAKTYKDPTYNAVSLYACDNNDEIPLIDKLPDTSDNPYEDTEDLEDVFQLVKDMMLEDLSEFQFNRILIQLQSRTVDNQTSYLLRKYRAMANPEGMVLRKRSKNENN